MSTNPAPFVIWIDADACPKAVRQIVFRASFRLEIPVHVVANATLPVPRSSRITLTIVEAGADVADDHIIANVVSGDIVITADIPLANAVVEKGALAIDIRGQLYSDENIGQRFAMRNLFSDLRDSGMRIGGPPPFKTKDKQRFAATFDRTITKLLRL